MNEFGALGLAFAGVTWLLGLSFFAGKLSERVAHQEIWREEHNENHDKWDSERREDLQHIYEKIDNLWGQKFNGRSDK